MANERKLGRGLESLYFQRESSLPDDTAENVTKLRLSEIHANREQPRSDFDPERLNELVQSIREQGIIQPLVVRPAPDGGGYQIVAGERRYRAAQKAGLMEVPVVVKDYNDTETMLAALVENLQREDLNPVEECLALVSLKETLNLTQDELAQKLGKSRSAVANSLRLKNLPEEITASLRRNEISAGHARALLGLEDSEARKRLYAYVLEFQCSVRETEKAANMYREEGVFPWEKNRTVPSVSHAGRTKPEAIKQLQRALNSTLPCKTSVSGTGEKGKITLKYTSAEELQNILARLGLEA